MISEGIKNWLEAEGFGTVNVSMMPDKPNNTIAVYDETAPVADYMHSFGSDNFGLQIITRGSYQFAKEKILDIHKAITMLGGVEVDEILIVDTQIQTPPAQLSTDKDGERMFTAHYIFLATTPDNKFRQV
jgi:uncharacterized radical SAM superfamily protein